MRQFFGPIGWEKKLLAFFVPLALLILIGPFGTYEDLDFWERSVFWVIVIGGVGFFMHITMTTALRANALGKLPQVARLALGATLGAFPGAAIVVFVNAVFRPPVVAAGGMPLIWMQVAVIGFLIGVFEYIDWRRPGSEKKAPDLPPKTKLHARLKVHPNAEIVSMTMQDHYVAVTTGQGQEMVLLRFSDAIAEVAAVSGLQIHRSHWVAAKHVVAVKKQGHRHFVSLSDGRSLPVSQANLSAARAIVSNRGETA